MHAGIRYVVVGGGIAVTAVYHMATTDAPHPPRTVVQGRREHQYGGPSLERTDRLVLELEEIEQSVVDHTRPFDGCEVAGPLEGNELPAWQATGEGFPGR